MVNWISSQYIGVVDSKLILCSWSTDIYITDVLSFTFCSGCTDERRLTTPRQVPSLRVLSPRSASLGLTTWWDRIVTRGQVSGWVPEIPADLRPTLPGYPWGSLRGYCTAWSVGVFPEGSTDVELCSYLAGGSLAKWSPPFVAPCLQPGSGSAVPGMLRTFS